MKREKQTGRSRVIDICLRYLFLLAIALIISFSSVFYLVLLKPAIYPTSFLINLFTGLSSRVAGDSIIADSAVIIKLIPACIAVSAYFMLLILNFTTPMNSAKKRVYSIIFSFALFCVLNVLRIFTLSLLLLNNFVYFDIVHKITWYSLSVIIVAGVWFLNVYLFGIKNIPIYSDFKYLINLVREGKK